MKKLIETLKALLANEAFEGDKAKYLVLDQGQYSEEDKAENENTIYIDEAHPAYEQLVVLDEYACGALISTKGQANFTAMRMLRDATGCSVTRGESDGFGWLSGVINTPKGMYVYG